MSKFKSDKLSDRIVALVNEKIAELGIKGALAFFKDLATYHTAFSNPAIETDRAIHRELKEFVNKGGIS